MTPVTATQHAAWRQALAARLKSERALRDLDQEAVCNATGLSRSTYSRIERGSGATLDQLVAIADAFGIPLPELMARTQAEMERRQSDPPAAQPTPTKGVRATVHKAGSPVNHDRASKVTKPPKR